MRNNYIPLTDVWKWRFVEETIHSVMSFFNYNEARPPILISNDVIKKIYYSFSDKKGLDNLISKLYQIESEEKLSLRPDGTVTYLSQYKKLSDDRSINRIYYIGPMFHRSNSESASDGQFHQFGAEALGSSSYIIDVEVIRLGLNIFKKFGLTDVKLELSSFGCEVCRPSYIKELTHYWKGLDNKLCKKCSTDYTPYKIESADCKNCQNLWEKSPSIFDYLCKDCQENFGLIKRALANLMITYTINPKIKMNFEYYNQIVFRYRTVNNKKNHYIGSGGRYDYLAKSITGKVLPAIGLSSNTEELISLLEEKKLFPEQTNLFKVYIMATHLDLEITLLQIVQELHDNNIKVIIGTTESNYHNQLKVAQNDGSSLMIVIDNEMIREGKATIYNLVKNHKEIINISDILKNVLRLKKALSNDVY
ncbi:MAG: ATP phosphoribosyltransferase regulatory subunit [Candidatus Cloacimonetes bacterium]|nr:ATP phosphoribosyltransferase regulatory subunit [Candidatus Cloacimonadota bacterium]